MILYDCEIKNLIEPDPKRRNGVFTYANGWTDYLGMGIACICAYDYSKDEYRVFLEDNLDGFSDFIKGRELVGYNNHRFDDWLIDAHGIKFDPMLSYDMLTSIWKSVGLGEKFNRSTHSGFGLDDMIRIIAPSFCKPMDASLAPALWQVGKRGKVIDYCLHDVRMLKILVDCVQSGNPLINPKNRQKIYPRLID